MTAVKINKSLGIIFFLIIFYFSVFTFSKLVDHSSPVGADDDTFLQAGLDMKNRTSFYNGAQTPLFPLLLSLFARSQEAYFVDAKLFTFSTALICLLIIFLSPDGKPILRSRFLHYFF